LKPLRCKELSIDKVKGMDAINGLYQAISSFVNSRALSFYDIF